MRFRFHPLTSNSTGCHRASSQRKLDSSSERPLEHQKGVWSVESLPSFPQRSLTTYRWGWSTLWTPAEHQGACTTESPPRWSRSSWGLTWPGPVLGTDTSMNFFPPQHPHSKETVGAPTWPWGLRPSPKSASFSSPLSLISRFWGFRSRCRILRRWQ